MSIEILHDISTTKLIYNLLAGIFVFGLLDFVKKYNKVKHIPGPMPLPFIGNSYMLSMLRAPFTWIKDIRKQYGSVYCVWFGPTPWVIFSDYESCRIAFIQDKTFPKDETYSKYIGIGMGDSLVTARDREKHRKDKSMLLPYFTKKKIETLIPEFCENSKAVMDSLLGDKDCYENFDVNPIMGMFTLRFIMKYIWDCDIDKKPKERNDWMLENASICQQICLKLAMFKMPLNRNINPLADYLYTQWDRFFEITKEVVEEKKSKEKKDDLLQLLLDSGCTEVEISNHSLTLLGAGQDTTAHWLGMSVLMLAKNPVCQQKCLEEAKAYFDQFPDGIPEQGDILPYFRYTLACMKETLRLKPIIACTTRISTRESIVTDNDGKKFKIPEDLNVILALYLMQRDYEDPSMFKPERFMGDEQGYSTPRFFPFAYGPRSCIGKILAVVESVLVVAHMVKEFEILEAPGYKPKYNLFGISATMQNGIKVSLRRRCE